MTGKQHVTRLEKSNRKMYLIYCITDLNSARNLLVVHSRI